MNSQFCRNAKRAFAESTANMNLEEFQQGTNPTVPQLPENSTDHDNDGWCFR
jgi:hypothetical protein